MTGKTYREAMGHIREYLHVELLLTLSQDLDCSSACVRHEQRIRTGRSDVQRSFRTCQ